MSREDTMRIVAEVVDKYSIPIKDMQRAVNAMARGTKGAHEEAAKAAREHAKHLKELHERFAKVREVAVELVTPALAAVGIAGLSAAEAIKSVVEASRHFGEVGRALEQVHTRSGMSISAIREAKEMASQLGESSEDMAKGLANMGELLDQTARKMPEAMNKWNQMPLLFEQLGQRMAKAPRDAALGMALDFTSKMTDKAQRRQVMRILGLPENYGTISKELIDEARRSAAEWEKKHPFDPKTSEEIERSWNKLDSIARGFRADLEALTSKSIIHGLEVISEFLSDPETSQTVAHAIDESVQRAETTIREIKALVAAGKAIIDGPNVPFLRQTPAELWEKLFKKSPNQRPKASGVGPADPLFTPTSFSDGFGKHDAQNALSESVKQGVLAAFREWAAGSATPGGGFTNASFGGSGGGGRGFGGGGYRQLPNGDDGANLPGGGPEGSNAAKGVGGGINRDKWRAQLDANPALKERFFRHSLGENTHPTANQAVMEEAANRADIRGNKRFDEHGNLSYFQGYYRGAITPKLRKMLEENYRKVFTEGSDVSKGAIDNSSSWLALKHQRTGRFRETISLGGDGIAGHRGVETFQIPGTGESGSGERRRYAEFRRRQLEEAAQRQAAALTASRAAELEGRPASMRHHIRRRGSVLQQGKQSGLFGGEHKVTGDASLKIDLNGFPKGTRTATTASGMFKEVHLNRGRAMPMSSMDG